MIFSQKTRTEGSLIFEILKNPEPMVINIINYLPNKGSDPGEPSSSSTAAVNKKRCPFQFRFLFIPQPIFAICLNHKFAGLFRSLISIHIFA
jgi:hypothetical protein